MKHEIFAYSKFCGSMLGGILQAEIKKTSFRPIIICLGTDKVLADSLGPIAGTLMKKNKINTYVYGCLERPVSLSNLDYCIRFVRAAHPASPIWIVDASTSKTNRFGTISVSHSFNPFLTYAETEKPQMRADLFITGTASVASQGILWGARLKVVQKLAETIASALTGVVNTAEAAGA